MTGMVLAATLLLVISAVVAGIDVIWIHLVEWKLYSRPETFYEHQVHTLHATLAGVSVFLLFCYNLGGVLLWGAATTVVVWFLVEILDLLCEKESRASRGGLSSFEYALHIAISGLRFSFIALILAAKPADAWKAGAPLLLEPEYPVAVRATGLLVGLGSLALVAVHLWLMLPRYRAAVQPREHA
ncbi:MAG: hypothetical protein ACLGI9_00635 [Thermoanaerobaculia bacterium]